LQDPYGITMWPEFKGRDGCRTPMPWATQPKDLGFSEPASAGKPWLPVAETHRALAVDVQTNVAGSLLGFYRQLLRWRKGQPALRNGSLTVLPAHPQVLAFVRSHGTEQLLCVFNFSAEPVVWAVPTGYTASAAVDGSGLSGAVLDGRSVRLAPWGGAYYRLA
jgi:alpha-glucosidase